LAGRRREVVDDYTRSILLEEDVRLVRRYVLCGLSVTGDAGEVRAAADCCGVTTFGAAAAALPIT
jgi:hypothetical protein